MLATAMTSLGLGDNKKLRCASVFVSPMALGSASHTDASSSRRITMTQQAAMQRRRTTLAATEKKSGPSKSKLEDCREDDEEGGTLGADWGGTPAAFSVHSSESGGHKHTKGSGGKNGRKTGKELGSRERGDQDRSKGAPLERKDKGQSLLSRWGLLGGPWRSSGESSDEEEMQRHVKNVHGGGIGGGKTRSSEEKTRKKAKDPNDARTDRIKRRQKGEKGKRSHGKMKSKRKDRGDRPGALGNQHAAGEAQGDKSMVQGAYADIQGTLQDACSVLLRIVVTMSKVDIIV